MTFIEAAPSKTHLNKKKLCPETGANVFSKWTYSWLNNVIFFGKKHILQEEDLYELDPSKRTEVLTIDLEKCWQEELARNGVTIDKDGVINVPIDKKPSLYNAMKVSYFNVIAPVGLLRFASDMGANLSPVVLKYLIQYVSDSSGPNAQPRYVGYFWINPVFC